MFTTRHAAWPILVASLLVSACRGSSQSAAGTSAVADEPPFVLQQVGRNVWAAIDNPKARASAAANAGVIVGSTGVAVVDTLGDAAASERLLQEIRRLSPLPVRFVINTHHHLDHVAGNGVFAGTGAVLMAQRHVREWIRPENLRLFGDGITPAFRAAINAVVLPEVVYDQGADLYLGDRQIQVRAYPGHTGGDSVVRVPDVNVVFTGDLFWRRIVPSTMDGSTTPWVETLDALRANDRAAVFVPGDGEVGTALDVQEFRDYLHTVQQLVVASRAKGGSGDDVVGPIVSALRDRYGAWESFDGMSKMNVGDAVAELDGTKRVPPRH